MTRRSPGWLASLACGLAVLGIPSAARSDVVSAPAILEELKSFREMGSVLYLAAHPDDENTLLIAYLARGRNYRTAYLSLTRGDGGQNVLGPEFGPRLGVARTQELLAARRLDGGRQFFSRAMDFGYSKDYRETLNIWDRQQVLSDVVRVIREFRPDVVINRFSTVPGGTHGHHTASAVLGLEAFQLAGDPKAFPEQHLPPWQPKRIFVNGRGGNAAGEIRMEISGNDPVLGISFNELAGRSRAMHKTQGFGNFGGGGGGARTESFQWLAGEPATNDILDGVDTTWNRVPGGAKIGTSAGEIIAQFNPQDEAASVPALLRLRSQLAALPASDSVIVEKRAQLDHILQACLGLEATTTMAHAEVVPGEKMELHHSAIVHSGIPVRWVAVRYPLIQAEVRSSVELRTNETAAIDSIQTLPAGTPLSQPYWLREAGTPGMFRVDDAALIGRPENPPAFPVELVFEVGGQTLGIPDEPVQLISDPTTGGSRRPLDVIPPVSIKFATEVALFVPGTSHPVAVELVAARAGSTGTLQLAAPEGWSIAPANRPFRLTAVGERAQFEFTITAPPQSATATITASAEINGVRYRNQREEISYPHIPRQLLQPPASLKAVSLELSVRGKKIGYLPGAGDTVAEAIRQMGCDVTQLGGEDLTTNRLKQFDAVVIGVRAFNVRTDLVSRLPALFDFVAAGGNLIEQYNRPGNDLKTESPAPFGLHLSGERVTDETAAMTLLAPDHPALNRPNKISSADFDGWIQERGIYFPDRWDARFTPLLACHDPGESPLNGSLLIAPYGKGYCVYTSLVFFRELPAGVPGAYRLFANLISLGK